MCQKYQRFTQVNKYFIKYNLVPPVKGTVMNESPLHKVFKKLLTKYIE